MKNEDHGRGSKSADEICVGGVPPCSGGGVFASVKSSVSSTNAPMMVAHAGENLGSDRRQPIDEWLEIGDVAEDAREEVARFFA